MGHYITVYIAIRLLSHNFGTSNFGQLIYIHIYIYMYVYIHRERSVHTKTYYHVLISEYENGDSFEHECECKHR